MNQASFQQVSESAWLIELYKDICEEAPATIASLAHYFKQHYNKQLVNVTPSYTTLLLEFSSPASCESTVLLQLLDSWLHEHSVTLSLKGSDDESVLHTIPTLYDETTGPDLNAVANWANMSVEEVINLHSSTRYLIHAIGFAPGFAFAAQTDPRIQIPRLENPRVRVPAGSVAIAAQQTAIYPFSSPGGWHLLGRTPLQLVNYDKTPITDFKVGDTIEFESISREHYLDLGGSL